MLFLEQISVIILCYYNSNLGIFVYQFLSLHPQHYRINDCRENATAPFDAPECGTNLEAVSGLGQDTINPPQEHVFHLSIVVELNARTARQFAFAHAPGRSCFGHWTGPPRSRFVEPAVGWRWNAEGGSKTNIEKGNSAIIASRGYGTPEHVRGTWLHLKSVISARFKGCSPGAMLSRNLWIVWKDSAGYICSSWEHVVWEIYRYDRQVFMYDLWVLLLNCTTRKRIGEQNSTLWFVNSNVPTGAYLCKRNYL